MRGNAMRSVIAALALLCASTASSAWASESPVRAALHEGTVTGATIRWHSSYVLRSETIPAVELALALPTGTALEGSPNAAPVMRDGRIVGFRKVAPDTAASRIDVTLNEPFDRRASSVHLAPPLASGDAVQIVEVTGDDDLRFDPDARTLLERHVGFFAPVELSPSARDMCDHAVGYVRSRTIDDPIYLQGIPPLFADEGLRGTVSTRDDRARGGALGAFGIFVGLVIGLGFLQRRLAKAAKIENAERIVEAEFARLEDDAPPRA